LERLLAGLGKIGGPVFDPPINFGEHRSYMQEIKIP
jgi:hypothetical protein